MMAATSVKANDESPTTMKDQDSGERRERSDASRPNKMKKAAEDVVMNTELLLPKP
jgi:hypothetical protein